MLRVSVFVNGQIYVYMYKYIYVYGYGVLNLSTVGDKRVLTWPILDSPTLILSRFFKSLVLDVSFMD